MPGRPGTVPSLDAAGLEGLQLPSGVRCPVVISRLDGAAGWREVARWGDFGELERHTPATVAFDASPTGAFWYWDNNTVLNAAVRQAGMMRPSYSRLSAKRRDFFAALVAGGDCELGAVRFGGGAHRFSKDVAQHLVSWISELAPPGATREPPSLWLSSAGSYSTAHYDSFDNVFAMLAGAKRFLLAPAAEAHLFRVYPGTHPLARQARLRPSAARARLLEAIRIFQGYGLSILRIRYLVPRRIFFWLFLVV